MTIATTNVPDARVELDALFRAYHRELLHFAQGRVSDRDAAADLVQDAFLRFLAVRAAGDADRMPLHPRSFLWRVVGNLTIDVLRGRRRRGQPVPLDDAAEMLADPAPTADRRLEARQGVLALARALRELPPRCRQALLLSRLEGLTHAEIAARLGVSASMVSKEIMTALRHCLRRMSASVR